MIGQEGKVRKTGREEGKEEVVTRGDRSRGQRKKHMYSTGVE